MGLTPEQLVGARWSSAVICPRRCVYEASDVEPSDDVPESLAAIFWRSATLGNAYQDEYVEKNPGWEKEVEAPWGIDPATGQTIAVGHLDLGNGEIGKGIEVKVISGKLPKHAFLQIAGYVKFLGYESGEIHSIDPQSGRVTITPVDHHAFAHEVDVIVGTIEESLRLSTLPQRVCPNPAAWQARGCAFRTKCFYGWVGDGEEMQDGDVVAIANESLQGLFDLQREIVQARRHLQSLEGIRDHMRKQIANLPRGRWIRFGQDLEVRITPVRGTASLSVSRMQEAGFEVPPQLQEFVTEGKGHERWTFRQR